MGSTEGAPLTILYFVVNHFNVAHFLAHLVPFWANKSKKLQQFDYETQSVGTKLMFELVTHVHPGRERGRRISHFINS